MPHSSASLSAHEAQVAKALCDGALPAELIGFNAGQLAAASRLCVQALAERAPDTAVIRLDSFSTEDGQRRTRIAVVNDDMPFLVDSIAGVVSGFDLTIDRLLHPRLGVVRDAAGRLLHLGPAQPSGTESLIYLEMERADARTRGALVRALDEALAQVRCAVADWQPMRAALAGDIDTLGETEDAALLRWFLDMHLTQLGSARYIGDAAPADCLGIARTQAEHLLSPAARARALAWFADGHAPLLLEKSNLISTVHRRAPLDLIILPVRAQGRLTGLAIHTGLWTSAALAAPPQHVPIIRTCLAQIEQKYGLDPASHSGKALAHALTMLPRDLLVGMDAAAIEQLALTAMSLTDRPRSALILIRSPLKRHIYAFVWLPRDEVSTDRREAIAAMLVTAADATLLNWTINLGDDALALLRFTLDIRASGTEVDVAALNAALERMIRGWAHAVEQQLAQLTDRALATRLQLRYADAFPPAYRASNSAERAARDIIALNQLATRSTRVVVIDDDAGHEAAHDALRIYSQQPLALSDVVPVLENFGFRVIDETQVTLSSAAAGFIHGFTLGLAESVVPHAVFENRATLQTTIAAVLENRAENDAFNKLIVRSGLGQDDVALFRALFRYLRQTGLTYGLDTVVGALSRAPGATRALLDRFRAQHDPQHADDARAAAALEDFNTHLAHVATLDDDRILRGFAATFDAVLRTNAFAPTPPEAIAFKFESARVPNLPAPRPWREIFVYSPWVEGIHLRSGPVARGGLRWSDRRDDFRTEILGLMKAQRVKNAVIVPTGAKGGFYPKHLPPPSQREAWAAEGTESYRIFIRALLSLTDNIVNGAVVHPPHMRCLDGPDPYFVVAADKGTATFSDVANAIAVDHGFWLGDAFASGGSQGYDHKAMGITAKGAWVSVVRHFAEMGVDVQRDPVRVVGCGDMSGDVFGNGMLLSKSLKLVAAFDHRHIFIDPTPDPAASWAERARLFALPRSSWADYDPALISAGGGVFARSEKAIPLSAQMQALLSLPVAQAEPAEVIAAILRADVDLIWFGGIGTYIKAAHETQAEVGDRANDAQRVDAQSVRAKVIGEGANLGVTQAGRIAFAARGGRINTDFIDNSAGVDCSDHEVNIKIALNTLQAGGQLTEAARNTLLASMTDGVADLVLEDNRLQTLGLSIAEAGGPRVFQSLLHLIDRFEQQGHLDRHVEGIAADDVLTTRFDAPRLLRPELAVLTATAKLVLQAEIEASPMGDDPGLDPDLIASFPAEMQALARDAIVQHRLRRELIATQLANRMVNRLGLIHPFELAEEEGVSLADVAEAFIVCERLLNMRDLWATLETADMAETARLHLFDQAAAELRAHMADLLRNRPDGQQPSALADALQTPFAQLDAALDSLLRDQPRAQMDAFHARLRAMGAPAPLADRVVRVASLDGAIGLAALSLRIGAAPLALTRAFTQLGTELGLDWAQGTTMEMTPTDPWERLLAAGLARDFQTMRLDWLARHGNTDPEAAAGQWLSDHAVRVAQFRAIIAQARQTNAPSLAMFAQIAGQARTLLARG